MPVSIFAGSVGLSHRNRDDYERRFQNPGRDRPIVLDPGRYPLLVGLLEEDSALHIERPLLVLADPLRREGRITRFSVFASVASLKEASQKGWSEDLSTSDEMVRCFYPPLLPVVIAALMEDALPDSYALHAAIDGSGLAEAAEPEIPAASERARRAATALVRDKKFSRKVIAAYDGCCAMCGLDASLVQAAHVYPASAPGSHDEAWNGIALCPNHHQAFDMHMIGVHPRTRQIHFSSRLQAQVPVVAAMSAFVTGSYDHLAEPNDRSARPRAEMFKRRYEHFAGAYDWLNWLPQVYRVE